MSRITSARLLTISGLVGLTPVKILTLKSGQFLRVHNPNGSTGAFLAASYDGVTVPAVFGAGTTIAPLSADDWSLFVPSGDITLVSDQAGGANYTILYLAR